MGYLQDQHRFQQQPNPEGVKSATDLTPVFSMYKVNGEYPTKTYDTYQNYSECWKLQVGIRYVFN